MFREHGTDLRLAAIVRRRIQDRFLEILQSVGAVLRCGCIRRIDDLFCKLEDSLGPERDLVDRTF